MTTRPGNAALALHTNYRALCLAHLVRIRRTDGFVLRVTDHDRALTFRGEKYVPSIFSSMSAERREVGLRTPDQEMHSIIDGDTITVPDLMGQRYHGAVVDVYLTDWRYPWLVASHFWRRVRAVRWDGLRWVASLDGITQTLERPAGGRFGGIATTECPYIYGEPSTCKKNIASETLQGARVATVFDELTDVQFSTTSWPGSWSDNEFRYGEIRWLWGPPAVEGNPTAPTTATQLTDSGASWTNDQWVGYVARRFNSTYRGPVISYARITGNTGTVLTYESTAGMSGFGVGEWYDIAPDADNYNVVSQIIEYTHSSRRVSLFTPTPFPMLVGDSGIAKAGCDGLFSTCKIKGNQDNFGGNHIQPQPRDLLEIAR